MVGSHRVVHLRAREAENTEWLASHARGVVITAGKEDVDFGPQLVISTTVHGYPSSHT